jgi:hypothetical protein
MRKATMFLAVLVGAFAPTAYAQEGHGIPPEARTDHNPRPAMQCNMRPTTTSNDVTFFGDWPPTSCCNFNVARGSTVGPPVAACDNNISGVDVPFGLSAEICEFRGAGSEGSGRCRRFMPGRTFVGEDMNDIASSFQVEDGMIAYMNSSHFPTGVTVTVGVSGNDPGVGSIGPLFSVGRDGTWITQAYNIALPESCTQPTFRATTQNGEAEWSKDVRGRHATINLRIKPKAPFGPNNWVGVKMDCPSRPAGRVEKAR